MNGWGKVTLSLLVLFFWGVESGFTQSTQEQPNRLSIGIMGSITTGHLDLGSAFKSSVDANFEFQERLNNTLGFNIRYVATPEIALQTNVVFGKFSFLSDIFPDDALTFNNNYVTTSLTTQISLVRIFGASAENFNLFGSFGTGLMFNDISIDSQAPEIMNSDITPADHPFSNFFTTFGGGIRFNLGNRLDSYAQYEYSSASRDIIDGNFIGELLNLGASSEISNSWSAVTVGLQFKFGASNIDADWPTVSRIIVPEPPPERDMFERLEELLARQSEMFREEIDELSGRIDSLELALLEEKIRNEQLAAQLEEEERGETPPNEEMAEQIRALQQQVAELESALATERSDEQQTTIAETTGEPVDASAEGQLPRTKAVQRVRVQGEMLGVRRLPKPLPIGIILVPEKPEETGESDPLAQILEDNLERQNREVQFSDPDEELMKEIAQDIKVENDKSLQENSIVPKPLTDTIFEASPEMSESEGEVLAEAGLEEQENVFMRADSLRVIESIEELDSTSQGMAHVNNNVTQPDTADLEVPQPEQNEPEPQTTSSTDSDEELSSDSSVESDQLAQLSQTDSDQTDTSIDEGQTQEESSADMDAEQSEDEGMNLTWYAFIAVAILGAVYFIANMFKSKSDS